MGILSDEREELYYGYIKRLYSVSRVIRLEVENNQAMVTFRGREKFPLSQLLFAINVKPQRILNKMKENCRKVVVFRRFASLFRFFGLRDTKCVKEKLPNEIICISELADFPKSHRDILVLADIFQKRVELKTNYEGGDFSIISANPSF